MIFQALYIGVGVTIETPQTLGNNGDLYISKGDGTSIWADPATWGGSYFDTLGSAAAVQSNLDTHIGDQTNPHVVTAAQVGADPAGSAAAVQANLDTHTSDTTIHYADAPADGKQYAREDNTWSEVVGLIDLSADYAWTGTHSHTKTVHFGDETTTTVPAATATASIDLSGENHQTLDLSAATVPVTVTLTPPPGSTGGTLLIKQGSSPVEVTFQASVGLVEWWTAEPSYSGDADTTRPISWRNNQSNSTIGLVTTGTSGSGKWVDVQDYGADGVPSEDNDTPAIEEAIAEIPSEGGTLYFPPGTYTLETAVDLPGNITIRGDGYGSHVRSGLVKWINRGDATGLGLFSFPAGSDNVEITGLRFDGRDLEWDGTDITTPDDYPKLIYAQPTCSKFFIHRCWFENCNFEGVWNDFADSVFSSNTFTHVGDARNPGSVGFPALPALQPTGKDNVITDNVFDSCGMGTGLYLPGVVANNVFINTKQYGIGAGDGSGTGEYLIIGNQIHVNSNAAFETACINIGGVNETKGVTNIISNDCKVSQADGHAASSCIRLSNAPRVKVNGNAMMIDGQGWGILGANGGTLNREFEFINNTVVGSAIARLTYGYYMIAWNGRSDKLYSKGNQCFGLRDADIAYQYTTRPDATSFMEAVMVDDYHDGGSITLQYTNAVSTTIVSADGKDKFLRLTTNPNRSAFQQEIITAREYRSEPAPSYLSISANAIDLLQYGVLYREYEVFDTGAGGTVNTISNGTAGNRVLFYAYAGKAITFAHGVGNIITKSGTDVVIDAAGHNVVEFRFDGTNWHEV